jgi:hypothetical protein
MLAGLTDRVENWGRAMQVGFGRGRARSLEGLWRSPQPWDMPVQSWRGGIDLADAYAVELAWGSLPDFPRIILRARYCLSWVTPKTCRVVTRVTGLPCHVYDFHRHVEDSVRWLAVALVRDASENRQLVRRYAKKVLAFNGGVELQSGYN